ncbi:hypothetical protein [Brevundimonas sp.]|uniref:hypothetical protein n=1 Tax=Brevundimonas sp. TaxID=1871086 RepID=UPI002D522292|nr:hypothetical protein [Brevundimonas sp.]HYC69363.1 hypothetical protein [Brevundimonas sp.]
MRSAFASAIDFQDRRSDEPGNFKVPEKDASEPSADSVTSLKAPTFEYGGAFAASSRRAGRINAAGSSEDELRSLLLQRQHLLDKKFEGSMSRKDEIRLEYVRWSLDRIEDARHGEHLDRLESAISRYEDLKMDIQALLEQLNHIRKG